MVGLVESVMREHREVTDELVPVIERINSGETTTVEELGLDPEIVSPYNQRLFLLYAQIMKDAEPRYNDNPAFVHPARVAQIISPYVEEGTAIGYALSHELVEDVAHYRPVRFQNIREIIGPEHKDNLDATVLLSRPHWTSFPTMEEISISGYVTYVAKLWQVSTYGNDAHASVLIGDALDSQLDIGFLDTRDPANRNNVISRFIAQSLFLVQKLQGAVPNLVEHVEAISDEMKNDRAYVINSNWIDYHLGRFYKALELFKTEPGLIVGVKNHLSTYGFEILKS